MPARRERQRQTQQTPDGPAWQPVHRLAFVQRLMRSGYLTLSSSIDIFEQLTGSDSGECSSLAHPHAGPAAEASAQHSSNMPRITFCQHVMHPSC